MSWLPRRRKDTAKRNQRARRLAPAERLETRSMLAVVINEFHYDPDNGAEQVEFIELHNTDATSVNLSGWRIDEAVDYTFPTGASIAAGGYVVLTQNSAHFAAKFGFAPFGQWEVGDKLSNEGETIELRDAANTLVDTVTYQLGFPWPTTGDYGTSIELINPGLDNDLAGSWRSSGNVPQQGSDITLVQPGSTWSYRKGVTSNPPANWRLNSFNTATDPVPWASGATSIGYGDGDDVTVLGDMSGNYSTIYLRKQFTIAGAVPSTLNLRLYVDDGAIVTINGFEVGRYNTSGGAKNYNDTSGQFGIEAAWQDIVLTNAASYLLSGTNTIAVHVLNTALSNSDLSFNLELTVPATVSPNPTPGAQNSVFAANAAPHLRQLTQSVQQPTSGEAVVITIKATDPQGVQSVVLGYQTVDAGNYIRLTDAAYQTSWTTLAMRDDGLGGDAVAGDGVYSVIMPGSVQIDRRLVRYRITATDTLGASVTGPYADDPQPNFAYFVYDGVPNYVGSLRPGVSPNVTYSGDVLDNMATYHLIANATDVQNSQYNGSFNEVLFNGTLVYDGVVYDHIEFRNRGVASTYAVGKNKWKIEFLRGHFFAGRDDYGNLRAELQDEINILPGTNPWWRNDVSTDGTVLFEPVAFKLYELAGTPAPQTNYFQFRVIDSASENGANQYGGDYWGLYISIEQPDGSFLNERGLDDGNIYNMHGSVFGSTTQRHQGSESVTDRSDLSAFLNGIDGGFESLAWWEANLNWDSYFAWNIINHLVNNADIRPNENVNYYRNEVTGQWYVIPWDLDLTFEDAPHFGQPVTTRENIRSLLSQHPMARLAYENRLREITDLLLNNGDAAWVVQQFADVLTLGGTDQTIVDANQAQWDYNPAKNKPGIWYKNFNPALLPSEDFAGLVTYMQDYMSPGGYGYNLLTSQGSDAAIPTTPMITYVGAPGFGVDDLVFQSSAFSDPQGAGSFSKMEWRVAEVYNPSVAGYTGGWANKYELEDAWESGELTTFANQINIPSSAVEAGKTYRARVRMQDAEGHWSHWSDAVEFIATPDIGLPTLTISELHYNPAATPGVADSQDLEFIEVLNTGAQAVDLSGIQITQFANTPYTFPNGLMLGAGQRIVVPRNPAVFQQVYGASIPIAGGGYGTANLSNGGESIALATAAGDVIVSFAYDDEGLWPTTPDGGGPSLELVNLNGNLNDPTSWAASRFNGGSPGAPNQFLPGDYNLNGIVEQTDYDAWRGAYGSTVFAFTSADGNGDGVINSADYTVWRDNLGATLAPLNNLVLHIDPSTGNGWLKNDTANMLSLIAYSIESSQAALLPNNGNWNSLDDQGYANWEEASPTSSALSELTSSGALALTPGQVVSLGHILNTVSPLTGLTIEYVLTPSFTVRNGLVVLAGLAGQLNLVSPSTFELATDSTEATSLATDTLAEESEVATFAILPFDSSTLYGDTKAFSAGKVTSTLDSPARPASAASLELLLLQSLGNNALGDHEVEELSYSVIDQALESLAAEEDTESASWLNYSWQFWD